LTLKNYAPITKKGKNEMKTLSVFWNNPDGSTSKCDELDAQQLIDASVELYGNASVVTLELIDIITKGSLLTLFDFLSKIEEFSDLTFILKSGAECYLKELSV
jgi:hypothetical protein